MNIEHTVAIPDRYGRIHYHQSRGESRRAWWQRMAEHAALWAPRGWR